MAQSFTSAKTSINGKQGKLPALYSTFIFPNGSTIVDYGCGDEPSLVKKKVEENGSVWFGYDKYNQSSDNNEAALNILYNGVDYAVSCNLLNVIDDEDTLKDIIEVMVSNSKEAIFQIYAGDGSGKGKQTGPDQWQRNDKRGYYEELIKSLGYTITKATGNYIYVKGGY